MLCIFGSISLVKTVVIQVTVRKEEAPKVLPQFLGLAHLHWWHYYLGTVCAHMYGCQFTKLEG